MGIRKKKTEFGKVTERKCVRGGGIIMERKGTGRL